jgi:predicted ABC-type ATPase
MATRTPIVVVLGGPNGAGKSTTAARLLQGALSVNEFVNADTIGQGLSAYRPDSASIAAGRVMLAGIASSSRISSPADSWQIFDNSGTNEPRLVASKDAGASAEIADNVAWQAVLRRT